MKQETLIHLHPKTDYEKLLFANRYISELKESLRLMRIEKGKLTSLLQEKDDKLSKRSEQVKELQKTIKAYKDTQFDNVREINRLNQENDLLKSKLIKQ